MSSMQDELLKAAMELSEVDRLILANRLLDTLSEEMPGLSVDDPLWPRNSIVVRVNGKARPRGKNFGSNLKAHDV